MYNSTLTMKRVLHIVEAFGGGIVTYLNNLTKGQCEFYKVYIAYGLRSETPSDFRDLFDKRIVWFEVSNFKKSIGWHDCRACRELLLLQKEICPDIVHLHSSKAGAIGRILFHGHKLPLFYTPHGFSFLMKDSSLAKRLFYWLVEYSCSHISHCVTIACSEGEYKKALKLDKKATFVNNGVSPAELKDYLKEKEYVHPPVVCTVGRILPQKNPALFNHIATLLPNVKFVWIGDGEQRDLLTSSNIIITGWKSRIGAMKELMSADIFLLPSLWEGLPISLLEAMYLKKVCIVSDVIGNRDVIHSGINGFIANTAYEFADIINNIISGIYDGEGIASIAHNEVCTKYNADFLAVKYNEKYNLYTNNKIESYAGSPTL